MRKKFVEPYLANCKGFTLLEMLLSLFMFLLITMFISKSVILIKIGYDSEEILHYMDYEVFVSLLKNELRSSDSISVTSNRIYFYQGNETVYYERYSNMIRRRVNGKGHEPMLFGVQTFQLQRVPNSLIISIHFENGREWKEEVHLPPPLVLSNS